MRVKAILFDLGDTIMVEESQEINEAGITLKADLVPGMDQILREVKARSYQIGLVADTKKGTYKNVLRQHGLFELFDIFAISDEIGFEKPDPRIIVSALNALNIHPGDYHNVILIGNNLKRDIKGANITFDRTLKTA
jgi:HAD superfamily hydrolase (TIGR01549 family)